MDWIRLLYSMAVYFGTPIRAHLVDASDFPDPQARQQPPHAFDHLPHVVVRWRRGRMEPQRAVGLREEDAVEHEGMEVNVEIR